METEISFTVPKKALEEAMKLLDAVPSRNGITSSEFIKTEIKDLKRLRMSMSSDLSGDAIIPISTKHILKSALYLDRRMLKPFVSEGIELTKRDVYEFFVKSEQVIVKHGSRTAFLKSSNSASGYEPLPDFKNCLSIELQEEWTNLTNCATLCACTDPIAPALNCVHISPGKNKVYVRASDTLLVFQGILPSNAFPCTAPVALPLDLVDNLGLFSTGICHYTDKWAMLQFSIGHIWQAVKKECKKSFPDSSISQVVSDVTKNGKVVAVMGTQSLVEAADRISRYLQVVAKDNPVLTLKMLKGKKKAKLFSDTVGASFDESIMLEEEAEEDYIVEWSLSSVLPIFQYCKNIGSAKILQDENGRICLKAGRVSLVSHKKKNKKKKGKK